jgi:hypothetical protein
MTPFEIRLELLKIAREMLEQDYYATRDRLQCDWNVKVDTARHAGQTPPEHPVFPAYPSEAEIINKANILNGFVSQTQVDNKTSTKK